MIRISQIDVIGTETEGITEITRAVFPHQSGMLPSYYPFLLWKIDVISKFKLEISSSVLPYFSYNKSFPRPED